MAIAIIQTAFLGDAALSMLFAVQVRRTFPDEPIVFVCRPDAAPLARANRAIEETIIYDKRKQDRGITGIVRMAHRLRQRNVEHVFCLQRSIRTSLVALLSGARSRIGFATATGAWLLTHRVHYARDRHEIERNALLLEALGMQAPPVELPLALTLSPEQHAHVMAALEQCNAHAGNPLVAIAPGAVWATKRWLPERFVHVASQLQSIGVRIAFIGGRDDAELCSDLAKRTGATSLAGMLDPAATVAFLRSCALLIANDSAPTHLATLAACPTITIFGSTVPAFGFAPRAPRSALIEPPPLSCRPCGVHGRRRCPRGTLDCMHSITAEVVFERARMILEHTLP